MRVTSIQFQVYLWMKRCFKPEVINSKPERNHRFLEEALELVQSTGCTKEEALELVDYVYSREVGDPKQEVGGVIVTLAALCNVQQINFTDEARNEINRINRPEIIAKIRQKQLTKPDSSPLPGTP